MNVTTDTPRQAVDMAEWAMSNGIGYLDGGIMAVPWLEAMLAGLQADVDGDDSGSSVEMQANGFATFLAASRDAGVESMPDLMRGADRDGR